MGRDIAQKGCRRITMLRVPERAWLPLMQFPKDEPEQAAERQGRGKKNPRLWQTNQRDEDDAKGNNKSDRMARKPPRSIFSEWNDVFWMQLICARGGGRNVSVREMAESSHGEYPLIRYHTPVFGKLIKRLVFFF